MKIKFFSKQKKVKIEFCQKNLQQFLTEGDFAGYQEFLGQKSVSVQEYECQSRCEECKDSAYAIVNGEMVLADDSAELLDKMKQYN